MQLVGPPILRGCLLSLSLPAGKPPIPPTKPPLTIPQNPCAQFFFAVNPETPPETLISLLKKSWEYDHLTTLKLICYLKVSYTEGFYVAAIWLHKNHPLTLACNLREFASIGSLRDFPEILHRLVNEDGNAENEKMKIAKRAVCKYVQDPTYRFLHERVSDLFADLLRSDIVTHQSGGAGAGADTLSFAARDCPSLGSSRDRHTLLCESIAKKVFPRESDLNYHGIEDVHYAYRVRDRLRKEVLGPLRRVLEKEMQEKKQVQVQDCTLMFMKKAYLKMLKMLKMKDTANASKLQEYYQIILSMILKANGKKLRCFPSTPFSVIASLQERTLE
ncbi:uncharacterized protein [Spinacia oleracea]|uniref:DUF2828 domain-containing protein n=1 Tax=Spinacia oleracea TaxID=3562 RepID=A0A9R0JEV8_SPIOL|nr:uncharacterized protein LOC110805471 [Spinacia oleracea]